MKKRLVIYACTSLGVTLSMHSYAQLSMYAQLRTRTEWRNGQGAPLPKGAKPAFFTSQRTRLNVGYTAYRLKFGLALQDVRVWGQDASTINRTTAAENNGLMAHEAWAEILLTDTAIVNPSFSLKVGRQELVYDDQRLLGNLDWLQQARRHDAALLKLESKNWMLHVGAAFNQNRENSSGTIYNSTPVANYTSNTNGGAAYKSMQFMYAGKKLKAGKTSFLFFADQFSKYNTDATTNVKTFTAGAWSRATTGVYFTNNWNKAGATASAYYQFGRNANGQKLSAALLSGSVQYAFSKKVSANAGVDYTTGGLTNNTSNAFDPLYGTPHKFWGLMDYFYVASPFGKGGLTNYFIKANYKASDKLLLATDLHQFSSAVILPGSNRKSLGQELDVTCTYNLTRQIGIEGGYGHFFSTSLLTSAAVKNIPNAKSNGNWAYVMINIKPELLFK